MNTALKKTVEYRQTELLLFYVHLMIELLLFLTEQNARDLHSVSMTTGGRVGGEFIQGVPRVKVTT